MSKAISHNFEQPETAIEERAYPPAHPSDPWVWCWVVALLFALLACIRLTVPSTPFFDEVHYLPAAREMILVWQGESGDYINREHPLLAKQFMALGMILFGDNPFGWRVFSLVAGVIALLACMRALWFASLDRFATISFGLLLATGFHLFVHARIAMLDIFMVMFLALAAWQFAAAMREPETGRWRLALTGIAIGCALGAKWNAVPLAMAFGLTFFVARFAAGRKRLLTSTRGIPVPGISLLEAGLWLGLIPLIAYAGSFWPGYFLGSQFHPSPLVENGLFGLHQEILELQQQVLAPHAYQSRWPQWVLNLRGIWYLYDNVDGAQRGVLLIGNPFTMLAGIAALAWCLVIGIYHKDWTRIGVVIGYGVALGLWVIAPKPVQFYYHYVTPSLFLLAALALGLSDLRNAGYRYWAYGIVALSAGVFAFFYPILTAAPLDGPNSFVTWAWIEGWR